MAFVRPYTGFNGNVRAALPSMRRFIDHCVFLSGGGLWDNGSFGARTVRGGLKPSVHGTGRAVDLSWRRMPSGRGKNGFGNWFEASSFAQFLLDNADVLQIEHIVDYHARPFGRAYRCDKGSEWYNYSKPTVSGAPGGDWLHVEISPAAAADPTFYDLAFKKALGV